MPEPRSRERADAIDTDESQAVDGLDPMQQRTRGTLVLESGHFINVTDVAFGPRGEFLVSASADESLRLWDLGMACEAGIFRGHRGPVYHARLDAGGAILASAGFDRDVRIWDVATQRTVRVLGGITRHAVDALALSADGRVAAATGLAVQDSPRQLLVWKVETGDLIHTVDVPGNVRGDSIALALDALGQRLVYLDADDRVHALDIASGTDVFVFACPPYDVPADARPTGIQPLRRAVTDVTVLADGRIVVVCWDGVRLLDPGSGACRATLAAANEPRGVSQLDDGTIAVFGRGVELWNVGQRESARIETIDVSADAISPDGSLLAAADGRHIQLYDRHTSQPIRRLGSRLAVPHQSGNLARQFVLCTSTTAPVIVHGAPDGFVRVWDLDRGIAPRSFKAHEATIDAVTISPNGRLLATAAHELKVWELATGALLWTSDAGDAAKALAFSAEGSALVAGGWSGGVHAFDSGSGAPIAEGSIDGTVEAVAVSPWNDVMTAGFGGLRIWSPFLAGEPIDRELPPSWDVAISRTGAVAVAIGMFKWMQLADRQPGLVGLFERTGNVQALQGHRTTPRTVAFSHDGTRLATGGDDGELILWDALSATEIARASAHAGDVTGLGFLCDDRFVASIGLDGAVRVWDAEARLVATLLSLDDDDYIVVTDDNRYSSTREGLRAVKLRLDDRLAPFEEFDVEANRPDLVMQRLGYAPDELVASYRDLHDRRLRRLGITPQPAHVRRPELAVAELPGPVAHEAAVTLRFTVTPGDRPPERLMVSVNDVLIHGLAGLPLPASGAGDVDVALVEGDNELQLWAVDADGLQSARIDRRVFRPSAGAGSNLFVLAVGVSRYAEDRLTLQYAAKDASDLAEELRQATDRFSAIEVLVLEDATRAQIVGARTFLQQGGVGDHVVVFLSGHGALSGEEFYFLPSDFHPSDLAATAVSFDELEQLFDGIPARRRLLLIDACHSGEPDEGDTAPPPLPPGVRETWRRRDLGLDDESLPPAVPERSLVPRLQEVFADLRETSGAYVLAAAGANEYAFERDNLENGVFTASLLLALRNRPPEGITVSMLARIVVDQVSALTAGGQRPVTRRENLADDFVVV